MHMVLQWYLHYPRSPVLHLSQVEFLLLHVTPRTVLLSIGGVIGFHERSLSNNKTQPLILPPHYICSVQSACSVEKISALDGQIVNSLVSKWCPKCVPSPHIRKRTEARRRDVSKLKHQPRLDWCKDRKDRINTGLCCFPESRYIEALQLKADDWKHDCLRFENISSKLQTSVPVFVFQQKNKHRALSRHQNVHDLTNRSGNFLHRTSLSCLNICCKFNVEGRFGFVLHCCFFHGKWWHHNKTSFVT